MLGIVAGSDLSSLAMVYPSLDTLPDEQHVEAVKAVNAGFGPIMQPLVMGTVATGVPYMTPALLRPPPSEITQKPDHTFAYTLYLALMLSRWIWFLHPWSLPASARRFNAGRQGLVSASANGKAAPTRLAAPRCTGAHCPGPS